MTKVQLPMKSLKDATSYMKEAKPDVHLIRAFHECCWLSINEFGVEQMEVFTSHLKSLHEEDIGMHHEAIFGAFAMSENTLGEMLDLLPISTWPRRLLDWMQSTPQLTHQLGVALGLQISRADNYGDEAYLSDHTIAYRAVLKKYENPPAWDLLSEIVMNGDSGILRTSLEKLVGKYCWLSEQALDGHPVLEGEHFQVALKANTASKFPRTMYAEQMLGDDTSFMTNQILTHNLAPDRLSDKMIDRLVMLELTPEVERSAKLNSFLSRAQDKLGPLLPSIISGGAPITVEALHRLLDFGGIRERHLNDVDYIELPLLSTDMAPASKPMESITVRGQTRRLP